MPRAEDLFERIERGGEQVIDELIAARVSEELFLDFKRSSDDGSGHRLSDTDRNNLARAISGFGNSEGGVLVWGVDCSRDPTGADVARMKVPIQDPQRFVSWLEGAISGCTVPPHIGVRNLAISRFGVREGLVATIIPKSNHAPHQVVGRLQYFIRAGSDFVPTPHGVLAGMFGRRPQPYVFPTYLVAPAAVEGDVVTASFGLMVRNDGPGIAKDLFVSLMVESFPEDPSSLAFDRPDAVNWGGAWSFGSHISLLSQPTFRLAPEAQAQPLIIQIRIAPPVTSPVKILGLVGAGNSAPCRVAFTQEVAAIQVAYDEIMAAHRAGAIPDKLRHSFGSTVLGA